MCLVLCWFYITPLMVQEPYRRFLKDLCQIPLKILWYQKKHLVCSDHTGLQLIPEVVQWQIMC